MSINVLQSFPHKIGAARICTTAWHQAEGVAAAGADLVVYTGAVQRPLPADIRVHTTLAHGRWRIPYRLLGLRALQLHDQIVARSLPQLADRIDVVHAWPLGAVATLRAAKRLGIATVLERPNAQTRFAYEAVRAESERLGVTLPSNHEHTFNAVRLALEEREYALADALLCPSDFVAATFRERGYAECKLVRHTYGYDESVYYADTVEPNSDRGLNALFVGVCAVRKGLHFALDAWLRSSASRHGKLVIAGDFVPAYRDRLARSLAHSSVEVLGHSDDVPRLMRQADILLLPSIEEGFGLVVVEAMASGCVPLVSEACTEVSVHGHSGLRHEVGDVEAITGQLDALDGDRLLLSHLREGCLRAAADHTWARAGTRLLAAYETVLSRSTNRRTPTVGTMAAIDQHT